MQPSELWRRGVVLPLDDSARSAIEEWAVTDHTVVEFLPIDELFDELWHLGLFQDLNSACGTLLDDYEEDWLLPSRAPEAIRVLDRLARRSQTPAAREFLASLSRLLAKSVDSAQPALFVL